MENIRIQDDLYMYVNQKTLDALVIPDDKPVAGGFSELSDGVEKIMMDEFEAMAESKDYPNEHLSRSLMQKSGQLLMRYSNKKSAHLWL